jgi:hypothetical protein
MQNQEKSPKKGSVDFDRGGTGERGGECETVTVTAKPTEAGLQMPIFKFEKVLLVAEELFCQNRT